MAGFEEKSYMKVPDEKLPMMKTAEFGEVLKGKGAAREEEGRWAQSGTGLVDEVAE